MIKKFHSLAAALVIASTLSACSGSVAGTVQNPIPGIQAFLQGLQASGSAKTAAETTKDSPAVQQQSATDLVPYRSEHNAALNVWIVYYYSPSKMKSYVSRPNADKTVTVTEVTDVNLIYTAGDTLETAKVTVEPSAAAQTAATQVSNNTTTNNSNTTTNVTINNVYLISSGELKKKHNRSSSSPAYVVIANNQQVFIDASTGKTIDASTTTTTTAPAPAATASPATAAPTATASPATTSPAPAATTAP